ncbi:MAG: hypothetical protein CME06_15045 [Gemmatimonadetes bacterium]|nr:hypothetical protein [Gemmatimonadota bacterium]
MARLSSPTTAAATTDVWGQLRGRRDLPAFPAVINEINALLLDPTTSAGDLSEVICRDQSLTAKLLKLVNAAYYGFHRQITGIQEAVSLLGFEEMQSLALAASVMGMWDNSMGDPELHARLWDHSIAAGRVAREIAIVSPRSAEVADVFIGGLLHDIGKVVLQIEFPTECAEAMERLSPENQSSTEVETGILGVGHAEVGAWLLDRWQLPLELVDAVRWHHAPECAETAPVLAAILRAATDLARCLSEERELDSAGLEPLGMEERHVLEISDRLVAGGWRR